MIAKRQYQMCFFIILPVVIALALIFPLQFQMGVPYPTWTFTDVKSIFGFTVAEDSEDPFFRITYGQDYTPVNQGHSVSINQFMKSNAF